MVKTVMAFLANAGFAIEQPTAIFLICGCYVFIAVSILWVVGLAQGNHSIMDGYYGWAYCSVCWLAYALVTPAPSSPVAALLLLAVSLHGARLGYYLSRRWVGYRLTTGGDARYIGFTKTLSPGYWWKSYLLVMQPQTIVIMIISLPSIYGIATSAAAPGPISAVTCIGGLVFGIGLYYEWVADGQLQAFKADPDNKGCYLEHGVWSLTRHPNYFGNTCAKWGVWLIAVSNNHAIWWTVAGPLFNTVMLTKVLGVAFQDRFMGNRQAYRELMDRRGGFLPRLW